MNSLYVLFAELKTDDLRVENQNRVNKFLELYSDQTQAQNVEDKDKNKNFSKLKKRKFSLGEEDSAPSKLVHAVDNSNFQNFNEFG